MTPMTMVMPKAVTADFGTYEFKVIACGLSLLHVHRTLSVILSTLCNLNLLMRIGDPHEFRSARKGLT
jgi:hypothetical protein